MSNKIKHRAVKETTVKETTEELEFWLSIDRWGQEGSWRYTHDPNNISSLISIVTNLSSCFTIVTGNLFHPKHKFRTQHDTLRYEHNQWLIGRYHNKYRLDITRVQYCKVYVSKLSHGVFIILGYGEGVIANIVIS